MFGSLQLGIAGGIAIIAVSGWFYIRSMNDTIDTLRENNAQLQVTLETSEASNTALIEQAEKNERLRTELEISLQEAQSYKDTLIGKLTDHDLTRLSLERPGLIETRINDATKEIFDTLESISAN